jgi:hypothetical protein
VPLFLFLDLSDIYWWIDSPKGEPGGQPHVHVTTAISLAEFMFMKKGQWVR